MNKTHSEVIAAVEAMTEAFHRGDLDRVMESYEPGAAIVFDPTKPAIVDPARQREAFQQFFAISPTFTYGGHEVVASGDLATHFAPWTMKGTAPDGSTVEDQGLSVAVLRRQPDGRWLMVTDVPKGAHLVPNGAHE